MSASEPVMPSNEMKPRTVPPGAVQLYVHAASASIQCIPMSTPQNGIIEMITSLKSAIKYGAHTHIIFGVVGKVVG